MPTMEDEYVEIDVRPVLDQGRSPLPLIMNTVHSLKPGQRLRLTTAFEPQPLYEVLYGLGFEHRSRQEGEEHWVVEFWPIDESPGQSSNPSSSNT